MLNTLTAHQLASAQVLAGGGGGVAGDDGTTYPLRADISAGSGRWSVKIDPTAITVLSLILQGRVSSSHPWVNVSTLAFADFGTGPQSGDSPRRAAAKVVDLWPEMRLWIETVTGTSVTLDSWISG